MEIFDCGRNPAKAGQHVLSCFSGVSPSKFSEFDHSVSQRVLACANKLQLPEPGGIRIIAVVTSDHHGPGTLNFGLGVPQVTLTEKVTRVLVDPCFWIWACVDWTLRFEVAQVYYNEIDLCMMTEGFAALTALVRERGVTQLAMGIARSSFELCELFDKIDPAQRDIVSRSLIQQALLTKK